MKPLAAILAVTCALGGCAGGLTADVPNYQWSLVRMELDVTSLKNRGTVPFWNKPTGQEFGLIPRGIGTLTTTEAGKVSVQVTLHEPVVNYVGNSDVIEYKIVRFFGTRSDDGSKLLQADADPSSVALGTPTVMHVQELGEGRLRLQGATGDRLLPYVYIFDPAPARAGLVYVPYLP